MNNSNIIQTPNKSPISWDISLENEEKTSEITDLEKKKILLWDDSEKSDLKAKRSEFLTNIKKYENSASENLQKNRHPQSASIEKKNRNSFNEIKINNNLETKSNSQNYNFYGKNSEKTQKQTKAEEEIQIENLKNDKNIIANEKQKNVNKTRNSNVDNSLKNDKTTEGFKNINENSFLKVAYILKIQRKIRCFLLINKILKQKSNIIFHNLNNAELQIKNLNSLPETKFLRKLLIYFDKINQIIRVYALGSSLMKTQGFEEFELKCSFEKCNNPMDSAFLQEISKVFLENLIFCRNSSNYTIELNLSKFYNSNNKSNKIDSSLIEVLKKPYCIKPISCNNFLISPYKNNEQVIFVFSKILINLLRQCTVS